MKPNRFMLPYFRLGLLKRYVIPLFLLAMGASRGEGRSITELVDEIRKKKCRILVIDDQEKFRTSLRFRLEEKYSAEVEEMASGPAAIAAVRSGKTYDLIFTDLIMNDMRGTQVFQELQRIDPGLRIVIMSAFANSEEWKKAKELGARLIEKPIDDTTLLQILSEI